MARCYRIEKYLTAYADGELSPRLRARVEKHLAACESCRRELDSIRASDRILRKAAPPPVTDERWKVFRRELARAFDRVDRESERPRRLREGLPVYGRGRQRVAVFAGACAVVALAFVAAGRFGFLFGPRGPGGGDECIVDSIETYTAGYTPMYFTSEDVGLTVIWVFSDEVEAGFEGEAPSAP